MRVKVSTLQLGGCSGCHVSILDVGKELFDEEIEVVHSYLLMDNVSDTIEEDTDILLIEGAILTNGDEELVKRVAPHAKTVVAVGSCACFGGIACLGNLDNPFVSDIHNLEEPMHQLHA